MRITVRAGCTWKPVLIPSYFIPADNRPFALVAFVPQAKVGIVILSNVHGDILPNYLMFRFLNLYFGNNAWEDVLEALALTKAPRAQIDSSASGQTDSPHAARSQETYICNYSNQTLGIINISQSNGTLILYAGPGRLKMPLLPTGGDSFSLPKTGTGPVVTSRSTTRARQRVYRSREEGSSISRK